MSDRSKVAQSRTFDLPAFEFDSGERLDLSLHFQTQGTLVPSGENAVLMLHGTTGSGDQFLLPGIATALFGRGQPLDLGRYFIILPDAIGHGLSSKPSDGLGTGFPKYSYGDMVRAQHSLVTEHLGLSRLRLVLGTSMGGMQTWMWGEKYPDMMDALMPIASLPERLTGRNLLMRRIMLDMIRSDPEYRQGPANSVKLRNLGSAWNLFRLLVDSPARMGVELTEITAVDKHIQDIAAEAVKAVDANDAIWEFEASRDYDPGPALDRITAPLLAVNFADDEVNPANLGMLSRAISMVAHGRAVILPPGPLSRGHQTLAVGEVWSELLRTLLEQTTAGRTT
jgi:homoserine O-acetyltransferase/O-succinyltransferase